ncbi:S-layer homology domain-containing protein [Paenibacillus luteus]|uniref:S-layer homology domain-containing protein n=1 Tax=Paenibacillus luteus TaxID=2545753 RepID=UPI001141CF1C|nr:S-layer homology domain-containing protein [Paenibacillus luteus]
MLQISHRKLPIKQTVLFVLGIIVFSLWFHIQEVQASPNIEVKKAREVTDFNENFPGAIAYNGDRYIYKHYISEDGLTWSEYDTTFYDANNKITLGGLEEKTIWDGKRFVMIYGDDKIATSTDGVTWNSTHIPHKDADKVYTIQDFLFVNGTYYFVAQDRPKKVYVDSKLGGWFYVAGPNYFFTSKDLKSFKLGTKEGMTRSASEERPIWNLMWTGKYFLGNGNAVAMSKDGNHWIGGDSDKFISFGNSHNLNYTWDGKKFFIATPSEKGNDILSSVDGLNWKSVLSISNKKVVFTNVGYNGKEYIAIGKGKVFYYSLDGVKWNEVEIDSKEANLHSVLPTKTGFLIAGDAIYNITNKDLHTPSNWAAADIQKATKNQLVSDELLSYYKSNISRKDFSRAIIQLYEALTGLTAETAKTNPFVDTSDSYILKAYELGIVQGREKGKFAPNDPITRQDISILLYKVLKAANIQISVEGNSWQTSYQDVDHVAAYAVQALQFFNHNQIINGKENNRLIPKGNTTKEEAIVLLERVFEKFNTRPIVELEESIPVSGIEAMQVHMENKGYSFGLDRVTRENYKFYSLKNNKNQKLVAYEQAPKKDQADIDRSIYIFSMDYPDYFYSDINLTIDYAPKKDDYKLPLLQEMIEREKGVELPGLSDELKNTLQNVKISYAQNTGRKYIKINGINIMYIVFRESNNEEYILKVYYQSADVDSGQE